MSHENLAPKPVRRASMNGDSLLEEAKTLYSEIQTISEIKYQKQMRIAEICVAVCEIKQGNYRHKGAYNLSNFAKDSGIPRSSVKEWVDTFKRVIPVVGVTNIKSAKDWFKARKIAARYRQKQSPPDEQIREGFDEPTIISEFIRYNISAMRLEDAVDKRNLNLLSEEKLSELMEILDRISDKINDHLTRRKRERKQHKRA